MNLRDFEKAVRFESKKKDENGRTIWFSESETVARLMQMYQELTKDK